VKSPNHFDEDSARRVIMVQAFEAPLDAQPGAAWARADADWATRVARESLPEGAAPAQALAERAHHALHRLRSREPALEPALHRRVWSPRWVALAAALGLGLGLAIDAIGSSQRISLLAPPVWGVIVWNLLVYGALCLPWGRAAGGLRGWLARRAAGVLPARAAHVLPSHGAALAMASPIQRFQRAWAELALPLGTRRAALLMHTAAAALALGLCLGMYLRGLVLDYRAGWESTFLEPATVQAVLSMLLAPAVALTGIAVPDVNALQALRLLPGQAAQAPAAAWIHLYAAMLLITVIVPRLALALLSAWRAARAAGQMHLPLQDAYFQRLLRELCGSKAVVQVFPHGSAPAPESTLGLQAWLNAALGAGTQLHFAPATAYGEEDNAATLRLAGDTTLRLVLSDLGTTPEAESHGRFAAGLRQASTAGADLPLLWMCDESSFAARFAKLPERLLQRRQAWQQLAQTMGLPWLGVHLVQPDLDQAAQQLHQAQNQAQSQAQSRAQSPAQTDNPATVSTRSPARDA